MRRTLVITTRLKNSPEGTDDVRLFTMNDRQASLFNATALVLAETAHIPLEQATVHVEKTIVCMLDGKMPKESAQRSLLALRMAFPTLRHKDIQALPRLGCPRGRLTALVLGIDVPETRKNEEGQVTANVRRNVLVKLDRDQADFYNDAIRETMHRDNCSKDRAWLIVNNVIAALFGGATMKEGTDEVLVMRAVNLFPGMSLEEALALPLASEDDVREWSFTTDRSRDEQRR